MKYEILAEGWIAHCQPGTPQAFAAGPRCAIAPDGSLVASFMFSSGLGRNDFKPMLTRSTDGGASWSQPSPIHPEWGRSLSVFGSISRAPSGDLLLFGSQTSIASPTESFWSEATQGLKENKLFWSASADGGRNWAETREIPMPFPGSAEAPGPLCVMRSGRLVCCYSPYNTFDPKLQVKRNQVVCVSSGDHGKNWSGAPMLAFPDGPSSGAEAWVVELSDGKLLGTSWHIREGEDPPNAYALSSDGGRTWSATASAGIYGQSTALAPLPGGRVLFAYNQRKRDAIGVWLAVAKPTPTDFGVERNERVWAAEIPARVPGATDHKSWTDFSFGEPCVTVLPDGSLLLALWAVQPGGSGIPYVKLRL